MTLSLRHVPTATRLARSSLRAVLTSHGLGRRFIADAEIVMDELVANAVEHGRADDEGRFEAAWRLTPDELVIRVCDSGRSAPLVARTLDFGDAEPHLRGRGLAIVAALASTWRHETVGGRTLVTAVLTRPRAP